MKAGLQATSFVMFLLLVLAGGCTGDPGRGMPAARPQNPIPPLPYRSQEVRFENPRAGMELAGTLTLPSTKGRHPAIVLVSGSGLQDRDETVAGHKPFLVLADHLTRRGIAVLRYDDRGVGDSTGDFAAATIRDFAGDARAAIEFLQTLAEIDARHIALAGHSEGGIVVPMVALDLPGQVACLVLLATPGRRGEEIFYLQDAAEARAKGIDENAIERSRQRKQQIFAVLKEEPDMDKAADRLRRVMRTMTLTPEEESALAGAGLSLGDMINRQIRMLNNAATRLFLVYDPIPALARLDIPVLALTGERNLQVPPEGNLPLIEAALEAGPCPPPVTNGIHNENQSKESNANHESHPRPLRLSLRPLSGLPREHSRPGGSTAHQRRLVQVLRLPHSAGTDLLRRLYRRATGGATH